MSKFMTSSNYKEMLKNNEFMNDKKVLSFNQISQNNQNVDTFLEKFIDYIRLEHKKNKIPLIVTGSGISMRSDKKKGISNIFEIVDKLKKQFENKKQSILSSYNENTSLINHIENLFRSYDDENLKKEKILIGKILNIFQNEPKLQEIWTYVNDEILKEVQEAELTSTHELIYKMYKKFNAKCITVNFDGLLIKELIKHDEKAFSIPCSESLENFFLRSENSLETIEIQARGDILYFQCKNTEMFCPEKEKLIPLSVVSSENTINTDIRKCPICKQSRLSYLSFPGSTDKERDMVKMLLVLWKYLSLRVSSVITFGFSGIWDSILVAHIGELLKSRAIPLVAIDKYPENSFIVKELVYPNESFSFAIESDHEDFSKKMIEMIEVDNKTQKIINKSFNITQNKIDDYFWKNRIQNSGFLPHVFNYSIIEQELIHDVKNDYNFVYQQLGLKPSWMGIDKEIILDHTRFNHSLGTMIVSSYIYDNACKNSGIKINVNERQFLRIASLMHDIGHIPFSHLIEEIFIDLNWKPKGYYKAYTHTLETEDNINKIFSKESSYLKVLEDLGYTVDDLLDLVNGRFGVGYLDAIINSAIDADKIDYLFRDSHYMNIPINLNENTFLADIVNGLTINPESLLSFSGISAIAAKELINNRVWMYENLYLRPGVRYLECCVKFLLTTYFVYKVSFENLKTTKMNTNVPDFGQQKIQICIKALKEIYEEISRNGFPNEQEKAIELKTVETIYNNLMKNSLLSKVTKEAIEHSFGAISKTSSYEDVKTIEKEYIKYSKRIFTKFEANQIRKAIKECCLRIPGALIIDIIGDHKNLSISDDRKKRPRIDGTNTFNECIIVPSLNYDEWNATSKANRSLLDSSLANHQLGYKLFIYRITKDTTLYQQALNLFDKLLDEKGIGDLFDVKY